MEQFSLEKWLQNQSRKICTREGKDVEIIYTNSPVPHNPIIGFIDKSIYTWTIDGKLIYGKEEQDKNDLFFADEEEESQSTEFSFGAFDSEFVRDEYLIPEGCEARIEGNKVIIEKIKEPVSEDLEEAARHYLLNTHTSPLNNILHQADLKVEMQYHKDIEDAYKAGAEEYKQHMKEAFQTEYEKGRFDMQQEMMKDAVEGTIKYEIGSAEIPQCDRRYQVLSDPTPIANAKLGNKVKIIICKTEQQ